MNMKTKGQKPYENNTKFNAGEGAIAYPLSLIHIYPFDGYEVRAVVGEHVEPQLEVGTQMCIRDRW